VPGVHFAALRQTATGMAAMREASQRPWDQGRRCGAVPADVPARMEVTDAHDAAARASIDDRCPRHNWLDVRDSPALAASTVAAAPVPRERIQSNIDTPSRTPPCSLTSGNLRAS
jgi:hypothetical protein